MKKEELIAIGIDEDKIAEIMKIHGKDIEKEKAKYADRDELKAQADDLKKQLEELQALKPEELQVKVGELTKQFINVKYKIPTFCTLNTATKKPVFSSKYKRSN